MRRLFSHVVALLPLPVAILAVACAHPLPAPTTQSSAAAKPAALELVESWPLETALDHADIRDA